MDKFYVVIHINFNLYHYAGNNPVKYTDPDGRAWLSRTVDGVEEVFYNGNIQTTEQAKSAYGKSAFVFEDGQQYKGYSFYNGNGAPYMTDSNGNRINDSTPIQGLGYDIFPGSATQTGVNPDTLHKNYFGTSYTGPTNPTDYKNNPNYDYIPHNLSEFGSIKHDKAYEAAGASGVQGALLNRDVVGADYKLAGYNFLNMLNPFANKTDRLRSYATFEAFMLIGTLKAVFIPDGKTDPMMVGGIYARH